MNKKIVNLTPHKVRFINEDGIETTINPQPTSLRILQNDKKVACMNGVIDVYETSFEEPNYIPPVEEDTVYVVSLVVCMHPKFKDRADFYIPS